MQEELPGQNDFSSASSGAQAAKTSIALSPTSGPPMGTLVRVTGAGFAPNETVSIFFDATVVLTMSAYADGSLQGRDFWVPDNALPGNHVVKGVGQTSGRSAQATFLVRTNWAQFGFGPAGGRYNRFENVLTPANVAGLVLKWSYMTGNQIDSSPTVVNGVVYIGSHDGNLYALDASSGAKLWSYHTSYDIGDSSPAVVTDIPYTNPMVYFGSNEGIFYALQAADGQMMWRYYLGGGHGLDSSPVADVSEVVFGTNDNNSSGTLYQLQAKTGAKYTSFTAAGPIMSPISTGDRNSLGVIIFGSYDGNVYCLDVSSGAKVWSLNSGGGQFYGGAAMSGDPRRLQIYIGSLDSNVYAIDILDGRLLWKYHTGDRISSSPAVLSTGAWPWDPGTVYIGSQDGNVYALNASTGAKLWSYRVGKAINSSPAVAGGVVFVGAWDGAIYALDAATGAKLWSYTTGAGINQSSPAVSDGVVYIGSYDGKVYAFHLPGR